MRFTTGFVAEDTKIYEFNTEERTSEVSGKNIFEKD